MATINGTNKDDNLPGTSGDDSIYGLGGNDTLNGLAGNDWLEGGKGKDALNGGDGNDTLYGGAGDDTLTGGAGDDSLKGDAGADTYVFSKADGQDEIDNYHTDVGQDIVKFTDLASTGVAAVFQGASRSLVLQYGTGGQLTIGDFFDGPNYQIDKIQFTDAAWTLADIAQRHNGTGGDDTLVAFDGLENTLNGLGGSDTLYGGTGSDALNGGGGNDELYGMAGADTLTGLGGNDYLEGNLGADTYVFSKADGQDIVHNYDTDGSVDKVKFTNLASTGVTAVYEGDSDDLILKYGTGQLTVENYFNDARERVDQFQFTDTTWILEDIALRHTGTSNNDSLYAFDGMANTLSGLGGNDDLTGGYGNDALSGGAGNDNLEGNEDNDTLNGGTGNDSLEGGEGADTYVFSKADGKDTIYNNDSDGSTDRVKFTDLASSGVTQVFQAANSSDLVLQYGTNGQLTIDHYFSSNLQYRVDQFQFTDTAWTLADIALRHNGTANDESLVGFDGTPNTLNGLGGNDDIEGGNSGDTLRGGADNDHLEGLDGNDTYLFSKADGQDEIDNHDTDDSFDQIRFTDLALNDLKGVSVDPNNADSLVLTYGTGGKLTVYDYFHDSGDYRVDKFQFADGNTLTNFVVGTTGNDPLLDGGTGNDAIIGLAGADTLTGGAGKDLLNGGLGKDALTGGGGADRFVYSRAADTGNTAAARDLITDFSHSQGDKIDVHAIDADPASAGTQAWSFVASFSGVAGEVKFDAASHLVLFDLDGNKAANFSIELAGVSSLSASDFIFA